VSRGNSASLRLGPLKCLSLNGCILTENGALLPTGFLSIFWRSFAHHFLCTFV